MCLSWCLRRQNRQPVGRDRRKRHGGYCSDAAAADDDDDDDDGGGGGWGSVVRRPSSAASPWRDGFETRPGPHACRGRSRR